MCGPVGFGIVLILVVYLVFVLGVAEEVVALLLSCSFVRRGCQRGYRLVQGELSAVVVAVME